jgi:hypothetical protein
MRLLQDLRRKPLHLTLLLVLLAAGGLYLYAMQLERRHDAAARDYLQRTLAEVANWQPQSLRRHLAPAAQQAVTDEQLDALVERYRELGGYRRIDDLQFARLTAALSLLGGNTLLGYSGTVRFEQGSAHLSAVLLVDAQGYHLYNFNLSSPQQDE